MASDRGEVICVEEGIFDRHYLVGLGVASRVKLSLFILVLSSFLIIVQSFSAGSEKCL